MDSDGILLVIPGKINMYLAPLLRHTVNKTALYGIGKVFHIGRIVIFLINVEMHPHTVP